MYSVLLFFARILLLKMVGLNEKHRHVVEIGLPLLAQAVMPLCFWWDAFYIAILPINGLSTSILLGQSSMEKLLNRQLNLNEIRIFDCARYPFLRPYNAHKF